MFRRGRGGEWPDNFRVQLRNIQRSEEQERRGARRLAASALLVGAAWGGAHYAPINPTTKPRVERYVDIGASVLEAGLALKGLKRRKDVLASDVQYVGQEIRFDHWNSHVKKDPTIKAWAKHNTDRWSIHGVSPAGSGAVEAVRIAAAGATGRLLANPLAHELTSGTHSPSGIMVGALAASAVVFVGATRHAASTEQTIVDAAKDSMRARMYLSGASMRQINVLQ